MLAAAALFLSASLASGYALLGPATAVKAAATKAAEAKGRQLAALAHDDEQQQSMQRQQQAQQRQQQDERPGAPLLLERDSGITPPPATASTLPSRLGAGAAAVGSSLSGLSGYARASFSASNVRKSVGQFGRMGSASAQYAAAKLQAAQRGKIARDQVRSRRLSESMMAEGEGGSECGSEGAPAAACASDKSAASASTAASTAASGSGKSAACADSNKSRDSKASSAAPAAAASTATSAGKAAAGGGGTTAAAPADKRKSRRPSVPMIDNPLANIIGVNKDLSLGPSQPGWVKGAEGGGAPGVRVSAVLPSLSIGVSSELEMSGVLHKRIATDYAAGVLERQSVLGLLRKRASAAGVEMAITSPWQPRFFALGHGVLSYWREEAERQQGKLPSAEIELHGYEVCSSRLEPSRSLPIPPDPSRSLPIPPDPSRSLPIPPDPFRC